MQVCPLCEGSGMRVTVRPDGARSARECTCRAERRAARIWEQASIPPLYENATLDSFRVDVEDDTHVLSRARMTSRKFVSSYPLETRGKGLLFAGTDKGVGKTHLAIGVLKGLLKERSATGIFCHYQELLKQVQNSYNREVQATELGILEPVFRAEVLVLDELGASRPSDWVLDTVSHILNVRYNERRTTIITTNFLNGPSAVENARMRGIDSNRNIGQTLGDRVGDRVWSRLQEMCVVVEMHGVDFRQTINLARFG